MSWNGVFHGYIINVAFWIVTIMAILRVAFPFPWLVWVLVLLLSPVIAFGIMRVEDSLGEAFANRIVLTGVIVALLFVADKFGGPFSWPVWLAALTLWSLVAVATARFGKKKGEPVNPDQPVGF